MTRLRMTGFAAVAVLAAMAGGSAAPPPALTADQIVAARQASYDMSVMVMAEMKMAVQQGVDVKKQFYPAKTLGRWARALPTLFPPGTGRGDTSLETAALPTVWTDRPGFEKAAAAYAAAADKLAALAQSGDSQGFADQLAKIPKACDACHDTYKAKD